MSPSASSATRGVEQDVDLTSSGIEHKMVEQASLMGKPAPTNGHSNNGHTNGNHEEPQQPQQQKPQPAELDASKLIYHRTATPRPVPDEETACAGQETVCTDHMITCEWTAEAGWAAPELRPYGPLSLMPTASCLHYATECFEGLKCYRGFDGRLRLFRADRNAARLLGSAVRVSLPAFAPAQLERLIRALVAADGPRWLPRDRKGSYLYLRPALIGTQPQLGVQSPRRALLFVTASFMPRMDAPAGGMRLHTSPEDMVRAWVGGFGFAKLGANYGPSLLATTEARARGYGQVLWLYGKEGYCTEAGASNFFVLWRAPRGPDGKEGRLQLVTAPLDDRLILDGVTRRSVLDLARERLSEELDVVERRYTIDEVLAADREGRLIEAFATGTAYFLCPVSLIHHRNQDVTIPMGKGDSGMYAAKLKGWLRDIMYGNEQHPWGHVVAEDEK